MVAVGRFVTLEQNLTVQLHCLGNIVYIACIAAFCYAFCQNFVIIHAVELVFEVLLDYVGLINTFYGTFEYVCLLVCKMDKL